jgi:hypothetical protein
MGPGGAKECGFHYNTGGLGWALRIDSSANIYCRGDITGYWSDRRLKDNLDRIVDYDTVLKSLTGYRFTWNEKGQEILQKKSDEVEVGLIAQDVQKVIPQAVKINKAGISIDPNADPFDYLTINYDRIIPFLVEGYKAQCQEIETLKSENKSFSDRLTKLEELVNGVLGNTNTH